jgi:HAMP domain-containing protein
VIYYAFEIVFALVLLALAFLLYRVLVNSSRFTRFIERTKGTSSIGDMNIRVNVAEEQTEEARKSAREMVKQIRRELRRPGRRDPSDDM